MPAFSRLSQRPETGTMSGSAADTADTTPPTLPLSLENGTPVNGVLPYTFSEAIKLAPDARVVLSNNGEQVATIALVGNPAVTLAGSTISIQLPQGLAYGKHYEVQFSAGGVADLAGNLVDGGAAIFRSFHYLSQVAVNLTGTPEGDQLIGSNLADTIDGGGGFDTINGYGGNDLLYGGPNEGGSGSQEQIFGGDGDDGLWGGDGNDDLHGNRGNDRLYGENGNDRLEGDEGDDLLDGGDGDDTLYGGGGANTLFGGAGDDRLYNDLANTTDSAGGLFDGGSGNDQIRGYAGNEYVGGAGNDNITVSYLVPTSGPTRISGGDGEDRISLRLNSMQTGKTTVSGGAGTDTYSVSTTVSGIGPEVSITDFTPGAGGDLIDLSSIVSRYAARNPFDDGSLRLLASGADTLLQLRDVTNGSYHTLLTLAGVTPAQVVQANFVDGYNPLGGTAGLTLTGTAGADSLGGTRFDDSLRGLGGADTLNGGEGNDSLDGGDGDDLLYGDAGDDVLEGRAGNDRLEGGAGKDKLSDAAGDDYLSGGAGDDLLDGTRPLVDRAAGSTLDGGDGNDRLLAGSAVKTVLGGAGDDEVTVDADGSAANRAALAIELGEGNDRLIVRSSSVDGRPLKVSGGAGADTYQFVWGSSKWPLLTISDFQPGTGGDVLDLYSFYNGNRSDNPFGAAGHARLVQDGSHVLLQIDADGGAGAQSWETRVVLENRRVADFTAANFTDNARPVGAGSPGLVLSGTSAGDVLAGGALDDLVRGGDGDDTLSGNGGADALYGDGGNDLMAGGDGNDRLEGGAGNDVLQGEAGDDELLGGVGNDTIEDRLGNNVLRGGEGDDQIHSGGNGSAQVFGEAGDDLLFIAGGGRFDGGDGHDGFLVSLDKASSATLQLTGGAGRDSYTLSSAAPGATLTITDFAAGAGGDFLDVDKLVTIPSGNPFALGGSLQFVQRGADTVLQLRAVKDGVSSFQDVFILRDVVKTALTRENIVLDFDPQGGSFGVSAGGTDGADGLVGTVYEDTLRGGAGNDVLSGGGGYDVLDGGAGIDTAAFSGTRSQYKLERVSQNPQGSQNAQDLVVSDLRPGLGDGRDRLLGIERLAFADGAVALDTGDGGVASQAYRIYRAAFDRAADEAGLGFWILQMDSGSSLTDIAGGFVRSKEFIALYGAAPTNAEIVTRMYTNILDRAPEKAGYDYWLAALDNKVVDVAMMLGMFSESIENRAAVAELIANGVQYQPYG